MFQYEGFSTLSIVISVVGTVLALPGLLSFNKAIQYVVGVLGSCLIISYVISLAFWPAVSMVLSMVMPVFRGLPPVIGVQLTGAVILFSVAMLASYIINNFGTLIRWIMEAISPPFNPIYFGLCAIVLSSAINNPAFNNEGNFYAFNFISAFFGLSMFIFRPSSWGMKQPGTIQAEVMSELPPDGHWRCPNFDEKRQCGHLNPAEAERCMSEICDHPNPYLSWICSNDSCQYPGKLPVTTVVDDEGNEREETLPGKGIHWSVKKCPKCYKYRTQRPEQTPFQSPEDDQYNAGTDGAPAPGSSGI